MGCGSSTAVNVLDQNKKPANKQQNRNKNRKNRPPTPGPKSISFEVKLDDDKPNELYRLKMPKRLQLLEEQATSNSITAEEIAERQKLAERRRKSALDEKVLKSKQFQAKVQAAANKKTNSPNSIGSRSTNNSLKSQKSSRTSTATRKVVK